MTPRQRELQEIKGRRYYSMINSALDNTTKLLSNVILDLLFEDFEDTDVPALLSEQYRIGRQAYPPANRIAPVRLDRSDSLLKIANNRASYSDQSKNYRFLDRSILAKRGMDSAINSQLNNISDDVFLEAVEKWLSGISKKEVDAVAKLLLEEMDLSGHIRYIQYAGCQNGDEGIILKSIMKKYSCGQNFANLLNRLRRDRNEASHRSQSGTLEIMPDTVDRVLYNCKQIASIFLLSPNELLVRSARMLDTNIEDSRKTLLLPDLSVSELEKKYNIPCGELLAYIRDKHYIKVNLTESGTDIVFMKESDVIECYGRKASDIDAQLELNCNINETISQTSLAELDTSFLKEYKQSQLSPNQLEEMLSQFVFTLDLDALLSPECQQVLTNQIIPIMKTHGRKLIIEWGVISALYSIERNSTIPEKKAAAKSARIRLYHLNKIGCVQYVGVNYYLMEPQESLFEFVKRNAGIPMCVLTRSRTMEERLKSDETPFCICCTNWRSKGIMIRTASKMRLYDMCKQPLIASEPNYSDQTSGDSSNISDAIEQERSIIPSASDCVYDDWGQPLYLGEELGSGGEGCVYRTDRFGKVAKIYHANRLTPEVVEKLREMQRLNIRHQYICWPESLIYTEKHEMVGFLMKAVPDNAKEMGITIFKLSGERVLKKLMLGWDRLALAKACKSIASTFSVLHKKNILVGDVNPRNLMVCPDDPEKIYFVDCDSYQFGKYICSVGMAEYSSPELLNRLELHGNSYSNCPRTMEDEQFSLASLLFHVLLLGQNPFAAKNNERFEDAIRTYSFAYRTKTQSGHDVPDGPYRMIWNNTPPYITDKFAEVFTGKKKYSAEEWQQEFHKYVRGISEGRSTRELKPTKYYDPHGSWFCDFICDGCKNEANMPKEKYEMYAKANKKMFCNVCWSTLLRFKEEKMYVSCDNCRQSFMGNKFDAAMKEYGTRILCPSCRQRYTRKSI